MGSFFYLCLRHLQDLSDKGVWQDYKTDKFAFLQRP